MKLSEAILLGRHTIEKPAPYEIEACAIPMALNGAGISFEHRKDEDGPYFKLLKAWPWISTKTYKCPFCPCDIGGYGTKATAIVFHPFDQHVATGQITLEQMCDWLRSIEPAELPDLPLSEQLRLEEEAAAEEGAAIEASNLPYPEYERNGR